LKDFERLVMEEETEFAGGALGSEVLGEMEGRAGACGYGGVGEKSTEAE
jgi:hypothetical protein